MLRLSIKDFRLFVNIVIIMYTDRGEATAQGNMSAMVGMYI